jgi:hypothetical protein
MKCIAAKWAFSSSSSRVISNDYKTRLARIRFPSGSIMSERVQGEIEVSFPGEQKIAKDQAEAPSAASQTT